MIQVRINPAADYRQRFAPAESSPAIAAAFSGSPDATVQDATTGKPLRNLGNDAVAATVA